MNVWMDLDDTYIYYWYWCDVKVCLRSRSQGDRSKPYWHLSKITVCAINPERIEGSWCNFVWWSVTLRGHFTRFIALCVAPGFTSARHLLALRGLNTFAKVLSFPLRIFRTKVFHEAYVIPSQITKRKMGSMCSFSCYKNTRFYDFGTYS